MNEENRLYRGDHDGEIYGDIKIISIDFSQIERRMYKCECQKCHNIFTARMDKIKLATKRNICPYCAHESNNIVGKTFGRLTVLSVGQVIKGRQHYICKCNECGETVELRKESILKGSTSKCNCKIKRPRASEDLTGRQYGYLKVIERSGTAKNGDSIWKCFCTKCNRNYHDVYRGNLVKKENPTTMCVECARKNANRTIIRQVNIGDTFGRVIVTGAGPYDPNYRNGKGSKTWKVKCTFCGAESIVPTNALYDSKQVCFSCRNIPDLRGEKYGRLTVKEFDGIKNNVACWICECDCKNVISTYTSNLTSGNIKSCGCLIVDNNKARTIHGDWNAPLYQVWKDMKDRCNNPNNAMYDRYGGRGIKVCPEWDGPGGYVNFKQDMSKGYIPHVLTIDRIDNDKGYSKDNCRWITHREQQHNKSTNRPITYNGNKYSCIQALLDTLNLPDQRNESRFISARIDIGWSEKEAITIPPLEGITKETWYNIHNLEGEEQLPDKPIRQMITFGNYNNNEDKKDDGIFTIKDDDNDEDDGFIKFDPVIK